MSMLECERVRDVLPDYAQDRAMDVDRRALERHVASCDACAAELRLVRLIAAQAHVPAAGLGERVIAATRRRPATVAWRRPAAMAAAATVALAMLGVSLLVREGRIPLARHADPAATALVEEAVDQGALTWFDNDPLLRSGVGLHDLTVEELELLISELGS